jgi:ABC-type branched-subunit amino acid transport system ATPase component
VALHVEKLSAWYGQARALWDVDVRVDDGEVVGILGRNGAGKTTLLRSIAGLQSRVKGDVVLDGTQLSGCRANEISRHGISLLRESGRCASSLTVFQHLTLGQRVARLRGKTDRTLGDVWDWFPLLKPLANLKAGVLSGGQRQALALAVAFISQPRLMLLDEPSAGLAPPVARDLFKTIAQLASLGATVLLVEQHPAWLVGVASRAYLLEVGKITHEGPIDRLASDIQAFDMA